MKSKIIAAVFCAAFGTALPPAFAQSGNAAVSDWGEFCLATRGAREVALARASAAGWQSQKGQNETSRYLDGVGGKHTLMFYGGGPAGTTMCMTSHPVAQGAPVHAALETLLGHPPTYLDGPWRVWAFDRNGDAFTWLSNDNTSDGNDAFAHGRAVLVRAGVERGFDIVIYEFMAK